MGKLNPAIMDKNKWVEKTVGAIRTDMERREGILVGYGLCFFDPFERSDKQWSFTIRLAHSKEHMDDEQRERLEATMEYIMAGVQKIMDIDVEELRKWESEESINDYAVKAKLQ